MQYPCWMVLRVTLPLRVRSGHVCTVPLLVIVGLFPCGAFLCPASAHPVQSSAFDTLPLHVWADLFNAVANLFLSARFCALACPCVSALRLCLAYLVDAPPLLVKSPPVRFVRFTAFACQIITRPLCTFPSLCRSVQVDAHLCHCDSAPRAAEPCLCRFALRFGLPLPSKSRQCHCCYSASVISRHVNLPHPLLCHCPMPFNLP